jgi:hypothetical protein
MSENEMIKHNAVCACSDFSEENRVLAIKKSRIYFIHDEWSGWHWFGWFLAVVFLMPLPSELLWAGTSNQFFFQSLCVISAKTRFHFLNFADYKISVSQIFPMMAVPCQHYLSLVTWHDGIR